MNKESIRSTGVVQYEQYVKMIDDIFDEIIKSWMHIRDEIRKNKRKYKDRTSSSCYYKFKNDDRHISDFSIYEYDWFFCMEEGQMSWNAYYPMDEDDKVTINGYYHKIV